MVIYKRQGAIKKVQSQHNILKLRPEKKLKIRFADILVFFWLTPHIDQFYCYLTRGITNEKLVYSPFSFQILHYQ